MQVATLQESDKSGPGLKVDVQPHGLKVSADADQLEQALLNLITNARDARLAAGRVAPVEIDVAVDRGGAIAFTVTDAGGGVPPEVRDRMFTPFFRLKPEAHASALASCARSRWRMAVRSNTARGTELVLGRCSA